MTGCSRRCSRCPGSPSPCCHLRWEPNRCLPGPEQFRLAGGRHAPQHCRVTDRASRGDRRPVQARPAARLLRLLPGSFPGSRTTPRSQADGVAGELSPREARPNAEGPHLDGRAASGPHEDAPRVSLCEYPRLSLVFTQRNFFIDHLPDADSRCDAGQLPPRSASARTLAPERSMSRVAVSRVTPAPSARRRSSCTASAAAGPLSSVR